MNPDPKWEERPPGFYWLNLGDGQVEVAEFRSAGYWLITGNEEPYYKTCKSWRVLSDRLEPPPAALPEGVAGPNFETPVVPYVTPGRPCAICGGLLECASSCARAPKPASKLDPEQGIRVALRPTGNVRVRDVMVVPYSSQPRPRRLFQAEYEVLESDLPNYVVGSKIWGPV